MRTGIDGRGGYGESGRGEENVKIHGNRYSVGQAGNDFESHSLHKNKG